MFIRTPPREPAPPAVPARPDRLTPRQAERAFYTELVSQLQQLMQTTTAAMDRLLGRSVNDVLLVETATFDADGTVFRQFRAPAGAVEVSNPNGGTTVATSTHPANPAAGAEVAFTVPAGQTLTLQSVEFTLTTSAAVANRQVQLVIDDGVNELWRILIPVTQAASLTYLYAFGGATNDAAVRAAAGINEVLSELPAITLGPGYRIRTVTVNKDAGDQYSAITIGAPGITGGHPVTVSQADKSATAPTLGVGVYVVPGGTTRTVSVATRHLTFYGVAGDTISFQVWAKGTMPAVV